MAGAPEQHTPLGSGKVVRLAPSRHGLHQPAPVGCDLKRAPMPTIGLAPAQKVRIVGVDAVPFGEPGGRRVNASRGLTDQALGCLPWITRIIGSRDWLMDDADEDRVADTNITVSGGMPINLPDCRAAAGSNDTVAVQRRRPVDRRRVAPSLDCIQSVRAECALGGAFVRVIHRRSLRDGATKVSQGHITHSTC